MIITRSASHKITYYQLGLFNNRICFYGKLRDKTLFRDFVTLLSNYVRFYRISIKFGTDRTIKNIIITTINITQPYNITQLNCDRSKSLKLLKCNVFILKSIQQMVKPIENRIYGSNPVVALICGIVRHIHARKF